MLAVQHYKLSERFRLKEKQKDQLQKRVEQLENRQAQDDAMLCIINRSWNMVILYFIFAPDPGSVQYVAANLEFCYFLTFSLTRLFFLDIFDRML